MKNTNIKRIILCFIQVAIIIIINFLLPLGDGLLPLLGIAFIIIGYFLKLRYSSWNIVFAYPLAYILANLLDTPHPFDGRLPNNMYPLWYLIFIGSSIAIVIFEVILKLKKNNEN